MDEIKEELTPIMCLCAVFDVAKTAKLSTNEHASVAACFNRAHKALEDAQNAKKPSSKKTQAKKRSRK